MGSGIFISQRLIGQLLMESNEGRLTGKSASLHVSAANGGWVRGVAKAGTLASLCETHTPRHAPHRAGRLRG